MALSNGRIRAIITTTSDTSYTVKVGGVSVFSGKACYQSGMGGFISVDITEILKPYVHAEEITSLTAGAGPASAAYSVSAPGHTVTNGSGTMYYCNDFLSTSVPASLSAHTWGLEQIPGQYYFSYSAQGSWSGAQYGSYADTCQYDAEVVFTDIWGMPQGIPVRTVLSGRAEWSGYSRAKDMQSSLHRQVPMAAEQQLIFQCYTPNLRSEQRRKITRWLSQSEFVYLYDVAEDELFPCLVDSVAEGNGKFDKMSFTLKTDF